MPKNSKSLTLYPPRPTTSTAIPEADFRAAQQQDLGWCYVCDQWTGDACEPDAHHRKCAACGNFTMFGADRALLEHLITFAEE